MSTDQEIDVDALRTELDQIKDAMGLQERYPSEFRIWLVYAVLVPLASLGSQAVVTFGLPSWGHWVSWGVFMSLGGLYQASGADADRFGAAGKPNLGLQMLGVFAYAIVVFVVITPLLDGAGGIRAQATIFAVFVGGVGASYVVMADSLRAYYIRRFDRLVLAAGGLGMLVLAIAIALVDPLQEFAYATFGVAYLVFGIVAYGVLKRRTGRDSP